MTSYGVPEGFRIVPGSSTRGLPCSSQRIGARFPLGGSWGKFGFHSNKLLSLSFAPPPLSLSGFVKRGSFLTAQLSGLISVFLVIESVSQSSNHSLTEFFGRTRNVPSFNTCALLSESAIQAQAGLLRAFLAKFVGASPSSQPEAAQRLWGHTPLQILWVSPSGLLALPYKFEGTDKGSGRKGSCAFDVQC